MIKNKPLLVIKSGAYQISSGMFNQIIALVVIRIYSTHLWGEVVSLRLIAMLAGIIYMWGSNEFIQKETSLKNTSLGYNFKQSINSRWVLLLLTLAVLPFLGLSAVVVGHLCFWFFARFFIQSIEPVINYNRQYTAGTVIETITSLTTIIFIVVFGADTLPKILNVYSLAYCLRLIITLWYWKDYFFPISIVGNLSGLKTALGFFLMSAVNFVHGKIDVYVTGFFCNKALLAQLHVLLTMLIIVQASSNWIFSPFIRNYYRVSETTRNKLHQKLIGFGLLICIVACVVIYYVATSVYLIPLNLYNAIAMFVYMLSPFFGVPYAYQYYKNNQTSRLLTITVFASLFACCMFVFSFYYFTPSLTLILGISAIYQAATYLLYYLFKPNYGNI